MEQIFFLILAAGAVFGGANVVFRRNPAICAVFLVFTFVCVSGMFLLLGYPFMAALQLMVYAGAIMVLFLFVVMLLNLEQESPQEVPYRSVMAPLLAGAILGLCGVFLADAKVAPQIAAGGLRGGQMEAAANGGVPLAEALFGRWVLPFEATGILLLVALLGVIVLARRQSIESRPAPRGPKPAATGGDQDDLDPAPQDEPVGAGAGGSR